MSLSVRGFDSNGSDRKAWHPLSESERQEVRDALQRVLASPSFSGSKRCSGLLRYVVEHSLSDSAEPLKEVTLGVQVFSRPPLYSTDTDNTVRTAASEVRKRLAQYYVSSGHEATIRIDLPPGSYVPEFQKMPRIAAVVPPPPRHRTLNLRLLLPAALALLLLTGATWLWVQPRATVIETFWGPVWDKSDSVLLVVSTRGLENPNASPTGGTDAAAASQRPRAQASEAQIERVSLSDAVSLARLSGLLQSHGKSWQVKRPELTTFTDLKASPAVLIGNPRNLWNARLSDQLRFTYMHDDATRTSWIQDRTTPLRSDWKVNVGEPYDHVYGLVSRVLDNTTGRTVVALEGVTRFGTQAATEFVTDAALLESVSSRIQGGRGASNVQVVITAKVVDGVPGSPKILAVHAW